MEYWEYYWQTRKSLFVVMNVEILHEKIENGFLELLGIMFCGIMMLRNYVKG